MDIAQKPGGQDGRDEDKVGRDIITDPQADDDERPLRASK